MGSTARFDRYGRAREEIRQSIRRLVSPDLLLAVKLTPRFLIEVVDGDGRRLIVLDGGAQQVGVFCTAVTGQRLIFLYPVLELI